MIAKDAQYAIGIDLGTTHCAMAYVDLALSEGDAAALHTLQIPQQVSLGQVSERELLASFLFLPHEGTVRPEQLALPWEGAPSESAGELARSQSIDAPGRVVASAKSWLCHDGVDRSAALLPLDAPDDLDKRSPIEAATAYLSHLRKAWEHAHPSAPIADQEVVITVPASFDPVARELTERAAKEAGFPNFTLLEEPQAALYAWLAAHRDWREQLVVGDLILVVDIGGGTCDFSLIAVRDEGGAVELSRVAVGDHILLGGDNIDLALATVLKFRLSQDGKELDEWQTRALTHACRRAKETLLSEGAPDKAPIAIPGRGSKLIGGTIRTELTREAVMTLALDGFFPTLPVDDDVPEAPRAGLVSVGLPYAQDPAFTRHLLRFLRKQHELTEGDLARPTKILLNGGVVSSPLVADRILENMAGWTGELVPTLPGASLDLAVSRGAAYFGYARRGKGVRIRGGSARSFYVGVETPMPAVPGMEPPVHALCVAPFGVEPGEAADPTSQELGLVVGAPARFRFFGSSVRRDDTVGQVLSRFSDDELDELEAVEVTLPADGRRAGDVVPVRLQATVTEVGVLRLEAVSRDGQHRYKLDFELRS